MSHDQNYKKLKQAMEMINIASLGLELEKEIKDNKRQFLLLQQDVNLDLLLEPEAFVPVLLSMADMLFESTSIDEEFKKISTNEVNKKDNALCSVVIKPDENYTLLESGFSTALGGLCLIDSMENLFQPNSKKQIHLDHTVKVWRNELAEYKEGQLIDIRNHREALFEGNLNPYPKCRLDLMEDKKSNLKNDMF